MWVLDSLRYAELEGRTWSRGGAARDREQGCAAPAGLELACQTSLRLNASTGIAHTANVLLKIMMSSQTGVTVEAGTCSWQPQLAAGTEEDLSDQPAGRTLIPSPFHFLYPAWPP